MKLSYTTPNNRMTFEAEGDTQQDLFRALSRFQEVFENTTCVSKDGSKSSDVVKFQVRTHEDNEYFELLCVDTSQPELMFAKKSFGCHKQGGGLFPKKNSLDTHAWVKWDKEAQKEVEV